MAEKKDQISAPPRTGSPSPAGSVVKTAGIPEDFNPNWRFYVAFGTLCIITLAAALDATSLSVALPIVADRLQGTAIEAFWSGTSFLLTSTVFQPNFASFSHIFGRKPMILVALTFFAAGAIIAALADNFAVLLVGRSIQGVGGGGIIVLTEVVVTDLVPLRLRGQWFGFISMMWSVGSVSGPIIGGAFAQNVSWRWIFWINLPLIALGYILIPIFLRLNFKTSSFVAQLMRVDWLGSFIFIASTTSFLIPVTWGGVEYPWDSWHTLVPLLLGAAGLIGFVLYEIYVPAEPLVRLVIFKNLSTNVTYLETVVHGMVLWSLLYYLPLYYEAVKGLTPIKSGLALFPQTFTVAPAAVVVGIVVTKTGHYRWAVWSGWVLATVGLGLLCILDPSTSTVGWIFLNLVGGLGMGILFPAMAFAIQASSTDENMAFAVAMYSFFRLFGQAIGVAIGGVIFQNTIQRKLLAIPDLSSLAVEYSRDASGLVQVIQTMAEDLPQRTELITAYADSLRVVWAVMCGLCGVALFASMFTRSYSLDRELNTEQGFQHKPKVADAEKSAESPSS
ncbi:MAG: hypothetical protein M1829_001393 [Trizodia sp. TS-e1964]|nr:MAG: hypothetical protein M1829_001393 [Trizodia sp. TS-e1964]